jgi:hypothetical protein
VSNAAGAYDSLASASTSGIIAGGHTGSMDDGSKADRALSERSPSLHHSIGSGSVRGGQTLSHMGSARRPAYTTGGLPSSGSSSAQGAGSLPTAGVSAPVGSLAWAGASLPSVSTGEDPHHPFSRTSTPMEDGTSSTPVGTPGTAGTSGTRGGGGTPGVANKHSFRGPFMARGHHGANTRLHGSPMGSGGRGSHLPPHHPNHHTQGGDTALSALFKVAGLTWRHTHSFAVRGGDGGDVMGGLDDVLALRKPSSMALSPGGPTHASVSIEATTSSGVLPHTASQGPGLPPTVEVLQRTQTSRRMAQAPSLQQWLRSQRRAADV